MSPLTPDRFLVGLVVLTCSRRRRRNRVAASSCAVLPCGPRRRSSWAVGLGRSGLMACFPTAAAVRRLCPSADRRPAEFARYVSTVPCPDVRSYIA